MCMLQMYIVIIPNIYVDPILMLFKFHLIKLKHSLMKRNENRRRLTILSYHKESAQLVICYFIKNVFQSNMCNIRAQNSFDTRLHNFCCVKTADHYK